MTIRVCKLCNEVYPIFIFFVANPWKKNRSIGRQDPKSKGKKNLAIDHCHETGRIRGLLCSNCNLGLGAFKDSVTLVNKAIGYIKAWNL